MKKSTLATASGIGLSAMVLMMAPVHAGSKHHEKVAELDIDIVAAAEIVSGSTDARIIEAEFESKRDQLVWEFELIDAQNREVDVKIDANTGEIIAQEIEGRYKKRNVDEMVETISMAQAIDIVKVVSQGEVVEAELEGKDGQLVWEMKLVGDQDKRKYRVDASSGALLP